MTIETNSSPIEFDCRNLHAERITDVLSTKPNLLSRLGLAEALGIVRMRGLNAILHRIRREVGKASDGASYINEPRSGSTTNVP